MWSIEHILSEDMTLLFREMEEKDIGRVGSLERMTFSMPWTEQDFKQALSDKYALYVVAETESLVIGYCGLHNILGEGDITNVAVAEEVRGQHIGFHLLQAALLRGKECGMESFTLEVRAGNSAAIHLYEKLGFKTEGVRRNFYEKPREDALIMWKRQEGDGIFSNEI